MTNGGKRGYFAPARGAPSAALVAAVALLLHAASAPAQDNRVAQIATYQGADRAQRLIDGARREGTLTLYSVAPTEDNAALVGAFERKFGIRSTFIAQARRKSASASSTNTGRGATMSI